MITIAELIEEAARVAQSFGANRPIVSRNPSERVIGRWEGEQTASEGIAEAIRALKAQYAGCIVAEGEAVGVYTGKDCEYGYDIMNMHDEVPTKTPLYRAKEPTK